MACLQVVPMALISSRWHAALLLGIALMAAKVVVISVLILPVLCGILDAFAFQLGLPRYRTVQDEVDDRLA